MWGGVGWGGWGFVVFQLRGGGGDAQAPPRTGNTMPPPLPPPLYARAAANARPTDPLAVRRLLGELVGVSPRCLPPLTPCLALLAAQRWWTHTQSWPAFTCRSPMCVRACCMRACGGLHCAPLQRRPPLCLLQCGPASVEALTTLVAAHLDQLTLGFAYGHFSGAAVPCIDLDGRGFASQEILEELASQNELRWGGRGAGLRSAGLQRSPTTHTPSPPPPSPHPAAATRSSGGSPRATTARPRCCSWCRGLTASSPRATGCRWGSSARSSPCWQRCRRSSWGRRWRSWGGWSASRAACTTITR